MRLHRDSIFIALVLCAKGFAITPLSSLHCNTNKVRMLPPSQGVEGYNPVQFTL